MKKTSSLLALGAILALSAFSSAQAQERWPRWYLGLSGGYTFMQDEDVSGSALGANKISLKDGYNLGGQIGYLPSSSVPFINTLRLEVEVAYHQNKVDQIHFTNGTSAPGSGNYNTTAYLVNAYYDFPTGTQWMPYVGGGVGYATVHLDGSSGAGNTSGSDDEFAYQGMAGIGYTPASVPNVTWNLGYRYFATSDPHFSATPGSISTKYRTHNLELGAKFHF